MRMQANNDQPVEAVKDMAGRESMKVSVVTGDSVQVPQTPLTRMSDKLGIKLLGVANYDRDDALDQCLESLLAIK